MKKKTWIVRSQKENSEKIAIFIRFFFVLFFICWILLIFSFFFVFVLMKLCLYVPNVRSRKNLDYWSISISHFWSLKVRFPKYVEKQIYFFQNKIRFLKKKPVILRNKIFKTPFLDAKSNYLTFYVAIF